MLDFKFTLCLLVLHGYHSHTHIHTTPPHPQFFDEIHRLYVLYSSSFCAEELKVLGCKGAMDIDLPHSIGSQGVAFSWFPNSLPGENGHLSG